MKKLLLSWCAARDDILTEDYLEKRRIVFVSCESCSTSWVCEQGLCNKQSRTGNRQWKEDSLGKIHNYASFVTMAWRNSRFFQNSKISFCLVIYVKKREYVLHRWLANLLDSCESHKELVQVLRPSCLLVKILTYQKLIWQGIREQTWQEKKAKCME